MKSFLVAVVIIVFSLTARAELIDKIVATVNGGPITLYELKNIAGFYQAKTPKQLLNEVIDGYLIEQMAKNVGIEVTDEEVEKYIQQIANQNNLTVDEFLNKLKESGIDLHYYKEGIKLRIYQIKFARRSFLPTIKISKKEIKNYIKQHKELFEQNTKLFQLDIITLKTLKDAQKAYKLLKEGKSFDEVAAKYSLNKQTKRVIPVGAVNPYLREKLLSLKAGEYSDIIESDGNYYIVKLLGYKNSSDIETIARNRLIEQRLQAKLNSWLKMVRSRADIEIYLK
ncbi:peptidyl-prolyl cis-trans isomerase [Hippea jasoniae]|uniref:peptidyl-prolyl cis-trans isomerase n=1 Tax=Hippea jasoniae TaxID=944479 RepID=UPI000555D043|nr:peptidyl-prolyl cis-trans isomerase [Hippea jasoniae]